MPPSTDVLVVYVGIDARAGWYWQRETKAGVIVETGMPAASQAAAQQLALRANADLKFRYPLASSIPVRAQQTLA